MAAVLLCKVLPLVTPRTVFFAEIFTVARRHRNGTLHK